MKIPFFVICDETELTETGAGNVKIIIKRQNLFICLDLQYSRKHGYFCANLNAIKTN